MSERVSTRQLVALQTLASRCFSGDTEEEARAGRLRWATGQLGREINSFKELRNDEAARLIELLKTQLGQTLTPRRRRPRSREAAMAAATHGRKGVVIEVEVMASVEDRAEIDALRRRAGMSEEAFASWLGSSRTSPTRGRRELRTVADCNRARWALQSMLRRAG